MADAAPSSLFSRRDHDFESLLDRVEIIDCLGRLDSSVKNDIEWNERTQQRARNVEIDIVAIKARESSPVSIAYRI